MSAQPAPVVHRIEPFRVAVLCGAGGKWLATNDPKRVTCPDCQRIAERRMAWRCIGYLHDNLDAPADRHAKSCPEYKVTP